MVLCSGVGHGHACDDDEDDASCVQYVRGKVTMFIVTVAPLDSIVSAYTAMLCGLPSFVFKTCARQGEHPRMHCSIFTHLQMPARSSSHRDESDHPRIHRQHAFGVPRKDLI